MYKDLYFQRGNKTKMIVFISTHNGVEFLYKMLSILKLGNQSDSDVEETVPETSLDVYRLHGDMSQKVDTVLLLMLIRVRAL